MFTQGMRRIVARLVASAAAIFWGFLWFGLIDLLVVVEQDADFDEHYLLESGWGLLFLILVTVPLVVLTVRPGDPVALAQLGVVTLAIVVAGAWRPAWPQVWNGAALALTTGVLAWLGRPRWMRPGRPDPTLLVLVALGAPAAVGYGAPLVRNTTYVEDITNGVSHYPMQAALALGVVGLVAVAALLRSRLPAWTAAFCAIWLGVESVVYPQHRASLGTTSGAMTVAWGVLVIVAVEVVQRREARDQPERLLPA
jgi:hypothetical protein